MKLWIAGTASCFPETIISNECLRECLGQKTLQYSEKYGVHERRSSLPLDYITSTKNTDCWEARRVAIGNGTDYAARAAVEALKRAGIGAEDLDLIIGDTPTPLEVTPSEGQRVGNRLGVKLPAYDMTSGTAAFVVFLERLMRLKPERCPAYALWVSTSVATQSLSFEQGVASERFGDGAVAVVVSSKEAKFLVESARYQAAPWCYKEAKFPINRHLEWDTAFCNEAKEAVQGLKDEASADRYFSSFLGAACEDSSIETLNQHYGDCVGVSAPAMLAQEWDSFSEGQTVRLLCAGVGAGVGSVQLRVA